MKTKKDSFQAISWKDGAIVMLDQRQLPHRVVYNRYEDHLSVAEAIRKMVIRGAPAIGCAGAYAVVVAARNSENQLNKMICASKAACDLLSKTRPTAVNLNWALGRMRKTLDKFDGVEPAQLCDALLEEANTIFEEDLELCRKIGAHGVGLIPDGAAVLTHCNTGTLATAGHGTALGVIRSAVSSGKRVSVLADETRPFLQGARLTAWELANDGIDVTVILDGAAASLMARGKVDLVIVGTDRVAANGDIANKIGTYGVALAAKANNIPFYVASPWSTIDLDTPTGKDIPIEERPADEVTHFASQRVVPEGVRVLNPAFDITPADCVTALITDRGVVQPPYREELKRIAEKAKNN